MTDDFSCLLHIQRIMWTTLVNACPLRGSIMDYFSCPLRHIVMDYFTCPLRENIMHALFRMTHYFSCPLRRDSNDDFG